MAAIQGKWYAASNGHDAYPADPDTVRFVYADQPDGERYIVAKVWSDGDDYESNARLIAAAPAMLDALRRIAHKARTGEGRFSTLDLCLEVIKKAEGRE
jgi:hypothetical protein